MRNLVIYLSALSSLTPAWSFRNGPHQLRDLLAFPKFQVDYLNELPLSKTDSVKCRSEGVSIEDDFLQTRFDGGGSRRQLEGNGTHDTEGRSNVSKLELVPMRLPSLDGQYQHEYLCLMPSDQTKEAQMAKEEEYEEVDPAQGWAALSHLDGKCLYSKQGWFTYSYCHNDHISQFRAAPHKHPHPPGGFVPEEDQRFEAYVLGQATRTPANSRTNTNKRKGIPALPNSGLTGNTKGKGDTSANPATSVDRLNRDHAVSYGLQPSSRYLVQRWSDGTKCDMTNKPREIEVQVHCSMTTTDAIYLIKETSICNYVMIIHSPHLCGLPGFRADHSDVEMAKIRCREVISDDDFDKWVKGEAVDMPFLTIGKEGHYVNLVEQEEQKEQKAGEKLGKKQVDQNWETVQLDDGTTVDGLKEIIDQMFSSTGEGEDEVMLITLDDEGEQPVVLQADLVGARREIRPMDPDTMALLVRDYLRNKDKPKKDEDEQEVKKLKDEL